MDAYTGVSHVIYSSPISSSSVPPQAQPTLAYFLVIFTAKGPAWQLLTESSWKSNEWQEKVGTSEGCSLPWRFDVIYD